MDQAILIVYQYFHVHLADLCLKECVCDHVVVVSRHHVFYPYLVVFHWPIVPVSLSWPELGCIPRDRWNLSIPSVGFVILDTYLKQHSHTLFICGWPVHVTDNWPITFGRVWVQPLYGAGPAREDKCLARILAQSDWYFYQISVTLNPALPCFKDALFLNRRFPRSVLGLPTKESGQHRQHK